MPLFSLTTPAARETPPDPRLAQPPAPDQYAPRESPVEPSALELREAAQGFGGGLRNRLGRDSDVCW